MALDAAFELIRASAGAAYCERYGLVTKKVVEEVARHFPDVMASTEQELRRLMPARADFTALLSTTTVVATYLCRGRGTT
jgi:DNA primase